MKGSPSPRPPHLAAPGLTTSTKDAIDTSHLSNLALDSASPVRALSDRIKAAKQPGSPDGDRLLEFLAQLAENRRLHGKPSEARAALEEASRLHASDPDRYPLVDWITCLLESGKVRILEKTPSQARNLFIEAWTLASRNRLDPQAVEAAQMMVSIEPLKQRKDWVLRAIGIAENSAYSEARKHLGALYTWLGWNFHELRMYEKSLETMQKALASLEQESGTPQEIFKARWSIARVLRSLNRISDAIVFLEHLLRDQAAEGIKDGRVYEEIAECFHAVKRPDDAQPYFAMAYEALAKDEWIKDNESDQLRRLKDLGKVK